MSTKEKIDAFIAKHSQWEKGLGTLREMLKTTKLEEAVKWGMPTYTLNGKNVVGIGAFKGYYGMWFFQGALLKDTHNLLINAQEGKTKALRQLRLTDNEIDNLSVLSEYVTEAIKNEMEGIKVMDASISPDRTTVPLILKNMLDENERLKKLFDDFTPGKKREFYEYINTAKRQETKIRRLEKIKPMIEKGISLNDKYK